MSSSTISTSKPSQENLAKYIILTYQIPHDFKPCIFRVPKSLKDTKPEAYTPKKLGLGLFHHCHPELHEKMIIRKREALNYYNIQFHEIKELIRSLPETFFEEKIRPCYSGYLDLDMETSKVIAIVDSIYLLYFLSNHLSPLHKEEETTKEFHSLVPDIMILENQIPYALLQHVSQHRNLKQDFPGETELFDKFYSFCCKLSPVKLDNDSQEYMKKNFSNTQHLLHFMHQLVVFRKPDESTCGRSIGPGSSHHHMLHAGELKYAVRETKHFLDKAIEEFNSATMIARGKGLRVHEWLQNLGKIVNPSDEKPSELDNFHSVSELNEIAHIIFERLPGGYGFGNIEKDESNNTFYLPVMTLDENSEVILRNLLAYEAAYEDIEKGFSSRVRDHMTLMCAITKIKSDVILLKNKKIIETQLKEEDVLNLCKRVRESMEKLERKSKLVEIICESMNKAFDNAIIVKACNWIKKWSLSFLSIAKPLFLLVVVLLLLFHSFCDIHDCQSGTGFGAAVGKTAAEQHPLRDASILSLDQQDEFLTPRKFLHHSS